MIRVIVADDEEKVCHLICQLIDWEGLGMQLVGTALNGIDAFKLIREEKPDLVLTDIQMPGYDGIELLKYAKELNPNIEFIIISGYSHFEYAQSAIHYGVNEYILKPVNREALNATLQNVRHKYLEQKNQEEEGREQQKQRQIDQARLRETLWTEMNDGTAILELERLNEKYYYHFEEGRFRVIFIQADVKENEYLEAPYIERILTISQSKLMDLFRKTVAPFCTDNQFFFSDKYVYGILNYKVDKELEIREALEEFAVLLVREMQAFEHVKPHVAVSRPTENTQNLPKCVREAELAMGQRLLVRNNAFLESVPDETELNMDDLFMKFSVAVRQSMDLQSTEQISMAVTQLHQMAAEQKLSGCQLLDLAKRSYRLFLLSGIFQKEYHFADREQKESCFNQKIIFCRTERLLFDYLETVCKRDMEAACNLIQAEKMRPVNQAKKYIQEHYAEPIGLEELAALVGFSSSYFSTVFRKETGKNFLEYLADIRLEEAKKLLRETRMTIEMVGKSVGMNDYKRFSKTFRKNTGISPKEYRNLYS